MTKLDAKAVIARFDGVSRFKVIEPSFQSHNHTHTHTHTQPANKKRIQKKQCGHWSRIEEDAEENEEEEEKREIDSRRKAATTTAQLQNRPTLCGA